MKQVNRNDYMAWIAVNTNAETTATHGEGWSEMDWWVDGRLCARSVYVRGCNARYFLFS